MIANVAEMPAGALQRRAVTEWTICVQTSEISSVVFEKEKIMKNIVTENLNQLCARLKVRFDGESSGLLWFADQKEGERSNGAGFVLRGGLAEPESLLEGKLCEIRQRFRAPPPVWESV